MKHQITNQRDLRRAFWLEHASERDATAPHTGKTQNDYPADVRTTWCDYVDMLARDGIISEQLAQRATL
jgi:hypothetical protein